MWMSGWLPSCHLRVSPPFRLPAASRTLLQEFKMDFIVNHYQDILAIIGAVVSLATLIVGLTPTTKDDEILGKIVRFLDMFSVLPVKK